MPVFANQLRKIDGTNPQEAIKAMANHIKYIQEQLEYTLANLDSSNVREIDTGKTDITGGEGDVSITGKSISLTGKNGEVFSAGQTAAGVFEFVVKGKNGAQQLYLSSDGNMVLTKSVNLSIDCGEW